MKKLKEQAQEDAKSNNWDKSTTAKNVAATNEDKLAAKIAQELLRENYKLRGVHSGASIKSILER